MKKEDLRIIKTKRNLYNGLMTMMKTKPFEEIKVSDICEVSLINRSTFYDHFSDKYELLNFLIKDLEDEFRSKLEINYNMSAKEYYMNLINLLLEHISSNIDIYSSIIKNNNNSIANDMFKNTISNDVLNYIKGNNKNNIPVEVITTFYVNGVINVCLLYINDPKKYKKEDILKYLHKLIPDDLYEKNS